MPMVVRPFAKRNLRQEQPVKKATGGKTVSSGRSVFINGKPLHDRADV
jgi:hypothetical protein